MTIWPVHELIPHAGEAILLDEVLNFDADTLRARATVRTDGPFHQADQSLPNWVGLEYMAQAVAAWAGCHARAAGEPVALGFLLGTRRYECQLPAFPAGMELIVDVTRSLHDVTGMGIFECSLSSSDRVLAAARLNVYRPPDAGAFLLEPFLESP